MNETSSHGERWIARALAVAATACTVDLGDASPEIAPFADSRDRCVLVTPPNVIENGPFSLVFPEGSDFVFGETIIDPNGAPTFLHSTAALADGSLDPCAPIYVHGADGQLTTMLDLSDEERAADSARNDGRQTVLWPISGFATPAGGMIFYQKVLFKNYFDTVNVGVGVARIGYGKAATRLMPNKLPGEPTLTWLSPQADWGTGAIFAADGLAYVYGCFERSQFDFDCRVARVAPEQAGDPDAYRYYAGDSGWVDRVEQAAVVYQGAVRLSGSYSAHLDAYVFVHSGILENNIYATTAPSPWGPFGARVLLFEGIAPKDFFLGDVNAHPGFGSADGQRLLVSYRTAPSGVASVHFVDLVLR